MRVLLVSNWLPPIRAGSSFYAGSLAQALWARGHEIMVVTLDWGPAYRPTDAEEFPVRRLPVVKLPKLPLFFNLELMGLAYTPSNARRLRSLVDEHRAELVHHVNHIFDTTFLSTRVARQAGIPVIGSITTPIQHQDPRRQRLFGWADRITLGHFGVARWDGIVSLDRTVHDYVGRQYGEAVQRRSKVIPFGVSFETAETVTPAARAQRPTILHVGHLHPFRNPVRLIEAMPHILRAVPQAQLLLAGRVDLRAPLVTARKLGLGDAQVRFLGEQPHAEVVRLMQAAHVFASWVTGPYHSLGTAPMEAMLCETPVVNDLPEDLFGADALRNGENIVLVDSNDPTSIASAIVRLLTDEAWRRRIGAGGRRFVRECLTWDAIAARMEEFYGDVLSQYRARTL